MNPFAFEDLKNNSWSSEPMEWTILSPILGFVPNMEISCCTDYNHLESHLAITLCVITDLSSIIWLVRVVRLKRQKLSTNQ